ncbi:hypothetical protein [Candidatus Hecatella orcuttiae]|nr:hypothetical protein [Candidatus Hecatella orcuttiae]
MSTSKPNQPCYRLMFLYWLCEACYKALKEGSLDVKIYRLS